MSTMGKNEATAYLSGGERTAEDEEGANRDLPTVIYAEPSTGFHRVHGRHTYSLLSSAAFKVVCVSPRLENNFHFRCVWRSP